MLACRDPRSLAVLGALLVACSGSGGAAGTHTDSGASAGSGNNGGAGSGNNGGAGSGNNGGAGSGNNGGGSAGSGNNGGGSAGSGNNGGAGGSCPDAGGCSAQPGRGYTIQLLVGTDAALSAQYGSGLTCYVQGILAHANYMFGKLAPAIGFHLVLAQHQSDVDKHGLTLGSDKSVLLKSWIAWAATKNVPDGQTGHFDLPVLLTAQSFGMAGWATSGPAICKSAGALVHDKGYYGAKTVVHEISHTLGLGHVQGSVYVMNPTPGVEWSTTSIQALLAVDPANYDCLTPFFSATRPTSADIPSFTLEQQCQTRYGVSACHLGTAPERCDRLVCQTSANACTYEVGPRLDGSDCGTGRWCMNGQCVDRPAGASSTFVCSP